MPKLSMNECGGRRVAVAMDKFKGTLTAREAVDVTSDRIEARWPGVTVLRLPLADGGEGTARVIGDLMGLERGYPAGRDALGRDIGEVEYRYGPECVVADVAALLSLDHLSPGERDVFRTSSAPVGDMLAALMERHPGVPVWLGVGGTATCDAGLPAAERLLALSRERGFTLSPITLLTDVDVPLLAPEGEPSAMSFVEQKGCPGPRRPEMRRRLEAALRRLEPDRKQYPGDGAGGGIPFAFRRLLGASVTDGAKFILKLSGLFSDPLPDIVITGEGSLDEQSAMGKLTGRIAREGRRLGIPVTALCGRVKEDFVNEDAEGPLFSRVISSERYALPGERLDAVTAARRLERAVDALPFCGGGTQPFED
ncbi:MAG: glycerate kinase [Muribaculaceae bacterium]|nr:glycerate kinase [Muribaculaceae bacterium]